MPLTGLQIGQFHAAILSGFNGSDLEMLVRLELDERLDNIVNPGRPLSEVVFDLIRWAEQHGRTDALVRAISQARPNNKEVQAAAKELLAAPAAAPAAPAGAAPLDGPRKARLRAVLVDQFPTRTGLAMLVDDSLSVNLNTVATSTNLTETVFELIQWAAIDPAGRLRPLLAAAVKERLNSAELKALRDELFGG